MSALIYSDDDLSRDYSPSCFHDGRSDDDVTMGTDSLDQFSLSIDAIDD